MSRTTEVLSGRLLEKYGIVAPPVPVEDIATAEGAIIARQRFDGQESGFAFRDGQEVIIGVNTATSPKRQRFTIAHELGHLEMHEGRKLMVVDRFVRVHRRDELSSAGIDRQEVQANAFAADLLMPAEMIATSVSVLLREGIFSTRDGLVQELARIYDVSQDAMGYRLTNLGILASF